MVETVLITGASSGIGLELARVFASQKSNLILTARSQPQLEQEAAELRVASKVQVTVLPCDLSKPGEAELLFAKVEHLGLRVDVLVNNAGFGLYGHFKDTSLARELEMIQLNMVAVTTLTKLVLPGMVARNHGRILNIASTAAFQAGPLMAVYYATKAYVLHFSEAIANELQGTGVTVTALCPGPTESAFVGNAKLETSKLFHNKKVPTAAQVAREGYDAMMAGKTMHIVGIGNRFYALMARLLPRQLMTSAVRQAQDPIR